MGDGEIADDINFDNSDVFRRLQEKTGKRRGNSREKMLKNTNSEF